MPRRQIIGPVILPLLLSGFLVQALVPMVRILTSYRALDEGHSAEVIGAISAVFSLLPILLTVTIGRFNDRGGTGKVVAMGALGCLVACAIFWLSPTGLAPLFVVNALLGISQTCVLAGLQVVTSRSSSRAHRDAVLGNYMVAISIGQAVGPLVIGLGPDRDLLLTMPVAAALILLGTAVLLWRRMPRLPAASDRPTLALREIAATRGLWWVISLGSIAVAAQDLLLAFLPVFGVERGLSPMTVGLLLSVRAAAAMVSRVLFGRAVRRFGLVQLALLSSGLGGAALLVLVVPLPVAAVTAAMASTGFGLGIALTCSVALTMEIAPPRARGTALSMRMTAIRVAQFVIPLCAGLVMAPLGAGGTFALSGTAILGAVALRTRGIAGHGGREL